MVDKVLFSSDRGDWKTPQCIIDAAIRAMGAIDLDPCSNAEGPPNVPARLHYTRAENGLAQPWRGRVYMNPPYGREIRRWAEKLAGEFESGRVIEAIALTLWGGTSGQ